MAACTYPRLAPAPRIPAAARKAGATKIARTVGASFSVGYTPGTSAAVMAALTSPKWTLSCECEGMAIILTLAA